MGYFARVRASILDRFRAARRRGFFPVLLAGLPFVLLAACSSAPPATYDLNAATGGFAARAGRGQLAVLLPDATLPADSGPDCRAYQSAIRRLSLRRAMGR